MSDRPRGERSFIGWLRGRTPAAPRVLIGPGDDTAAINWSGGPCLVTTDMLLEGSCFTLEGSPLQVLGVAPASPRRVGRKAMAVNLSDIAAMGGVPVAAVVSVGLPRRGGRALAEELYLGIRERADEFGVAIIGGDTNTWDAPLSINVTLLGEAGPGGIIRRSGAKPGNWILITGPLGGSILGKHLDFTPRIREAQALTSMVEVTAMIDVSDGLALDLSRLCAESGCGAVIWADAVPITREAHSIQDGQTPLQHALGDGEDFELLFTVSATVGRRLVAEQPVPGITVSAIGEVIDSGLWLDRNGCREPLPITGHEHAMD